MVDTGGNDLVEVAHEAAASYQTVTLPDGRDVSYVTLGDPEGAPVLVCHGWPATRVMAVGFHEAARTVGVKLVSPDRPGFGGSDPCPGRRLTDWPGDVAEILDGLGIDRAPALGISGGGPYAAACAALIPERISGVSLVSSVGPPTTFVGRLRYLSLLARYVPPIARAVLWWDLRTGPDDPEDIAAERTAEASGPDADIWRSDFGTALSISSRLAGDRGPTPLVRDLAIYARPWGFDLASIQVPASVWHGLSDDSAPPAMGRYLADRIPGCRTHVLEGEGHLSLSANHGTAILQELVSLLSDGTPR